MTEHHSFLYLDEIPLFSPLSEAETELLAGSAARKRFGRGKIIQLEGQPAEYFAVITEGAAKAVLFREDGGEILLRHYEPGDFFGELNICGLADWPYSIFAVRDTECILMSLHLIGRLTQQNGQFAAALVSLLSLRLAESQVRLRDVLCHSSERRVIRFLEHLAGQAGHETAAGWTIPEKVSHQAIADTCGLARETVSRIVSRLQKDGKLAKTNEGWLLRCE